MRNPYHGEATKSFEQHKKRQDKHHALFRRVVPEFQKVTQDRVWQDIDNKGSEIQDVIQAKMNELNNDIQELCLPTSAYEQASALLAGIPTSWSSRIEEKFRQKRELYQDLLNSKSDFDSVYNTNYNQIYIPIFQSLGRAVEALIPRNKTKNLEDFRNFLNILNNADRALNTCNQTCNDYISELRSYKQSAQNILSGLNTMLSQANGINWSKEDYCGSGAGTQSLLVSELEELLELNMEENK
jgi:hypothetical protein